MEPTLIFNGESFYDLGFSNGWLDGQRFLRGQIDIVYLNRVRQVLLQDGQIFTAHSYFTGVLACFGRHGIKITMGTVQ